MTTERIAGEPGWVLLDVRRLDSLEAAVATCIAQRAPEQMAHQLGEHLYLAVLDALLAPLDDHT